MRLLLTLLVAAALVGCDQPTTPHAAGQADVEVSLPHHACRPAGFPTKWDAQIQQAARRYLPAAWERVAPCGWRAQLAAESALDERWCRRGNPHGTSARCLGQLTHAAAEEVRMRAGITGSRTNPQASIRAGAFYLASMRRVWSEPRTVECRRELSVASYHAGAGTVIDGQRLARQAGRVARCYGDGISDHLPRHRRTNVEYVERVHRFQQEMSR